MNRADVAILFDHLYWLRDRILERAAAPGVPFVDPGAVTTRDLRATLVHELDVEWSWRRRLAGDDRTAFPADDTELDPADFPSVAAVRERWSRDEAEMRAWLERLTDETLAGPCRVEKTPRHPFWFHLQHLYSHGLQQLSDAAVLLSAAGHSPGEIDFLEFARTIRGT